MARGYPLVSCGVNNVASQTHLFGIRNKTNLHYKSSLFLLRLEVLRQLHNLLARLITELFLRGTQHFLQHRQDRPSKTLNHSVLLLVKRNDHFKHSLVLFVVFSERQKLDEHGEDIVERDVVGMSLDHASDATC
jgi:hypothetical protein